MPKRTVLVTDDQIVNRKILGKILSEEYQVLYAADGVEALACLRANPEIISAMLLDIVMPNMDGYQVLETMQKDPILASIPVIVSSQRDGEESELKALSLGAQDFIAKPYKANIIRHRLANTIKLRENAAMINRVTRDKVTGLYNRQFFIQRVEEKLAAHPDRQYDLICIDIDAFKAVNDTYGEETGDRLLNFVARQLTEEVGEAAVCGHFGAGVFYVLHPHIDEYTQKLFDLCTARVNSFQMNLQVKLRYGVYFVREADVSVEEMCQFARLTADSVRGRYGSFALYDESIRKRVEMEQYIVKNMQKALDNEEFCVYYQPKYKLDGEMLAGAEALVRWQSPEKGFMSPGEFIPLFERNGFITRLDRFVWERTCRDMHNWLERGNSPLPVSVNVSRADIYNPELVNILQGLIQKYNIPVQCLHLEITETAYTQNPQQLIETVTKLRGLGFIIEMDDFGSGYSSLNMLAEMPVDILKLDMRFIQQESQKSTGRGILSFVISLARWMNLAVIAEGVETQEQVDALRTMDCNYVQGYYYAKPLPREQFESILSTKPPEPEEEPSPEPEPHTQSTPQNGVMLIVDDIEVNRAVLAETFRDEFEIVEKENGRDALDYLNEHSARVRVVMLDLLMPVMDGFQVLGAIRADERMSDLPVVITSQGDEGSLRRALALNADDFITKPYTPELIMHRVNNVVGSYRYRHLSRPGHDLPANSVPGSVAYAREELRNLKGYFDVVRLVQPENTEVCNICPEEPCEMHACFSVWEKKERCNNCISLQAMREHGRRCKLEYSPNGLFFVISQYIPYKQEGAVIEMVTKLDDTYVDNVFDKELLFIRMDEVNRKMETDELTGTYNRRYLDRSLTSYIKNARKYGQNLALAMVDMDHLKEINDEHGHLAGDEAIRRTAQILRNNIAGSRGDFVSRFGGDEFVVVCRNIRPEVFRRRLQLVAALVSAEMIQGSAGQTLGISAGCANLLELPEDGTPNQLIRLADERLYRAKKEGRGRVVDTGIGLPEQ